MDTIRIKSTDEASQGPFVIINAEDFDADNQELFDVPPVKVGVADLRAALDARGIAYDPSAKKADLQALLDTAPAQ
jgi:hypothetical protein